MSAANDILSASFRHRFNATDDQVNKLHFRVGTPPTPNTAASHLEDLGGWFGQWYAEMAAAISNNVVAVDLTIYNVTADSPTGQTSDFGSYSGGTGITDALPPSAACLCLLYTGVKRVLGRIYLPTFTEGQQADGTWGSGTIEVVEDALSYLLDGITGPNGGTYTPVVFSPTRGEDYPILGFRVQPLVSNLKSRKPGRGS